MVELDVISVWGIETDLMSVQGSDLTWFCAGVKKDLVLMSGSKLTCFCVGASKLT